jgi:hypothetical protein
VFHTCSCPHNKQTNRERIRQQLDSSPLQIQLPIIQHDHLQHASSQCHSLHHDEHDCHCPLACQILGLVWFLPTKMSNCLFPWLKIGNQRTCASLKDNSADEVSCRVTMWSICIPTSLAAMCYWILRNSTENRLQKHP